MLMVPTWEKWRLDEGTMSKSFFILSIWDGAGNRVVGG
jgi:hypothetical protein